MRFLFVLLLVPFLIAPAFGDTQTLSTEKGRLDVRLTYDPIMPDTQTKIAVDFINPQTQKVQEHIDYTISVSKDDKSIVQIPSTHTSVGSVNIPIEFRLGEGVYSMEFQIEGILFQPIPAEKVSFDIQVGQASAQLDLETDPEKNGGCLIATAAYGTELAPQVQFLREVRDNTVLSTASGALFMVGFNSIYYSFAPTIADWERESPEFREVVKMMLTPMISTLSIMSLAQEGSEAEVLGLGILVILLNIGMYLGIPAFGILRLYNLRGQK